MPGLPMNGKEFMVNLYYASMGVTNKGIRRLIFRICDVDRSDEAVRERVNRWKGSPYLYDYYSKKWNLRAVGAYLEEDRRVSNREYAGVKFDDVTRFSEATEDFVGEYELRGARLDDLRNNENDVTHEYYNWSSINYRKPKSQDSAP